MTYQEHQNWNLSWPRKLEIYHGSPVVPVSVLPQPWGWEEQQSMLLLNSTLLINITSKTISMNSPRNPCTVTKLHQALMIFWASLPPTSGEEGEGKARSSRPEAKTSLMRLLTGPTPSSCQTHRTQWMFHTTEFQLGFAPGHSHHTFSVELRAVMHYSSVYEVFAAGTQPLSHHSPPNNVYDWLTSTFFPLVLTIHKNLNQSKELGTNPSFVGHKVQSTYQNSEGLQISNPSIPAQLSSFDRETHCVICPPWWKMCFVEGHSDKREAAFRKRPVCIFYFSAFFVFSERDHSFSALFVFLVRAYSALLLYLYFYLISFTFSYYYLSLCCQKRLIHIFHFLPESQFPLPTFWQHI